MALASTHHELDDLGGGSFRHEQHIKPIAAYHNGSLRRDPMILAGTGADAWPVVVDRGVSDFRIDPRIAGKSPLVHFGKGSSFARFSLVGANNVVGQVKGNTVTFLNVWNGADLRYTYGGHRLQEEIVLWVGHPRTFAFRLYEHAGFDPVTLMFGQDFRILQPALEPSSGGRLDMRVPLEWVVTQQGGHWVLSVTLPDGDWAGWIIDPTLSLQPGASDGKDTWLWNEVFANRNTFNEGVSTKLACASLGGNGDRVSLIQFDLSTLANAIISSAVLTLITTNVSESADKQFATSRLLSANTWIEGTKDGQAEVGSPCWLYAAYNTVNWAGSAGASTGGIDYSGTTMGSVILPASSPIGTEVGFVLDTAEFTLMVATNNGLRLWKGSGTEDAFASSDHATAAWRPKLVVNYTVPAKGEAAFNRTFSQSFRGAFG